MKRFLLFILCISFKLTFSVGYLKVLYVSNHKPVCDSAENCLLVRDSPTDSFQIFNKPIQGFTYEAGFEYCILVEVQTPGVSVPTLPFDSSSIKYVLSEIKSKIKTNTESDSNANAIAISIPDSSKWMLYKLRMKDGSTKTFTLQKAYLQFDVKNNTINGNTECNNFNGGFSAETTSLKFDNLVTTKMACGKHSIEPLFLNLLNTTTSFKITSKLLYLYKGKTLIGLFTKKK